MGSTGHRNHAGDRRSKDEMCKPPNLATTPECNGLNLIRSWAEGWTSVKCYRSVVCMHHGGRAGVPDADVEKVPRPWAMKPSCGLRFPCPLHPTRAIACKSQCSAYVGTLEVLLLRLWNGASVRPPEPVSADSESALFDSFRPEGPE